MSTIAMPALPSATARLSPTQTKARDAAQEFEGVFIQNMLEQMFSGLGGDGPLGDGEAGSAWRGMLVDQYASTISKNGGLGIAPNVYREILSLQEVQSGNPG